LPLNVIEAVYNNSNGSGDEDEDTNLAFSANFRGLLKSACMPFRVPIQILWPTTYDSSLKIARKLKKMSDRRVQDDATRAWNFLTAVYYKAGGLPWRIVRDSQKLRTSYVGISFYRSADGEELHTSTAQMFDERGEGLILRGGRASESKEDRRPHLNDKDANELLSQSLRVFRSQHGHFPARVVLHKTSNFNAEEIAGFDKALDEREIDYADYITLSKSMMRLYRNGAYPPLRGTLVKFDPTQAVLYTKGSVEFFRTYPGMYVPRPILIRCQKLGQPLSHIANEILALTKMNWNNTQFDGGFPVTVNAVRQVGEILKYVPEEQEIAPRYSFYM
jgi:argonaute-like protein implicated in RNA metabolism and viral defense